MPRIFIVLALVTVSVFAWMFYQYSVQKQDAAALGEYEQVLNEKTQALYTQAKNWQKPIQIEVDDDRLEGDYAEMAAFIVGSMRDSAELRNQYLRDLKAQHWDRFLDVSRLAKDQKQDYKETEAMLKAVADIVKEYELKTQNRDAFLIQTAKQLDIKNRYRQQLIHNLKENLNDDAANAIFALEKQSLQKANQLFALLKQHKWQNKNNMVMFYDDAPIAPFNALYKEMVELNQQMEQIKLNNRQEIKDQL